MASDQNSEPTLKSPVTLPDNHQPEPALGWTRYAEQLNGRFAMLGFVALIVLEFFTRQDFITWLGLR